MIRVENALKITLKSVKTLPAETVRLTEGLNRVLAEDIYADINIPQLDNSAMDGFAVRSKDTIGASKTNPKELEVVYDLKAGFLAPKRIKENEAIGITTGAAIPEGADSVVMVEYTKKLKTQKSKDKNKEFVEIFKSVKRGENVRRSAEDVRKGERVIKKGTLLNSAHIGMLASLGRATIKVAKRPKVAILATGDEVVDVDGKMGPGKLRSSNTYSLYAQVVKSGGTPKNLGIARDRTPELERKLKEGFDCDMLLTSGGVSVGKYDFVKNVLAKLGTDIKFWKVRMKPGKPVVFGIRKGTPVFGLPGNPVSGMVSFEIFVKPAIFKMLGQKVGHLKEVDAVLEEDIRKRKDTKYFLRARTRQKGGIYYTRTTGPQGSGILKSMMLANSLIILPEEKEYIRKGTRVKVKFLE